MSNEITVTSEQIREMISETARNTAKEIVESLSERLNLDNRISQTEPESMPCNGGENDMASGKNSCYSYIDENGEMKVIRLYGQTSKELDVKFQTFLMSSKKRDVPTVKDFVEKTYKPSYYPSLRPTCISNYDQYLKLNIIPFMGNVPMDQVGVDTIQKFVNWMATASERGRKKNLNEPTIRRVLGLVKRIFTIAFEMKIVDDVPVKKTLIKINAEKGGHHKPLTDAEIDFVRQGIPMLKSTNERLYMALLAYTGMRLEEVLGLRWEDVHLEDNYIEVKRAVTYPTKNHPHVDYTKTECSDRTVIISRSLSQILISAQKASGYILGDQEPLPYSTKERIFRRAKKNLGISGYDNHDFRTTFATQLCERGLTSKEAAGLLGHADTRMVEHIYARTRHSGTMKHLDKIEEIMGQNVSSV